MFLKPWLCNIARGIDLYFTGRVEQEGRLLPIHFEFQTFRWPHWLSSRFPIP